MLNRIKNTIHSIRSIIGEFSPEVAIVIGSGLGRFTECVEVMYSIQYSDITDFPVSSVEGHKGELIFGKIDDHCVVVMNGRFHYYEGYSAAEVGYGIRVMNLLGAKTLLISNAAGGINPDFNIGDVMLISDHINFIPNPLIGKNIKEFGVRFPEMSTAYSRRLREKAWQSAIELKSGVYVATTGPSYETAAEIKFFRTIGADAVGMSTAPEVIVARHCQMEVLGVSVITNISSSDTPPTHEEVIAAGEKAGVKMEELFRYIIDNL